MDLKRYIADVVLSNDEPYSDIVFPKKNKSIGIIGAGPAGLTCGYYLARLGYTVEIYDGASKPGGVLAFGIPEYRLPKSILAKEIDAIKHVGVKIHLNLRINSDTQFEKLRKKHNAVFVATGTQFSNKIGVRGEDLHGVYYGLDFLKEVNLNGFNNIGEKVVVVGGGSTAIDAARVALRIGAKEVTVIYRREIEAMPADRREVKDAIEEGIIIMENTAPVSFMGNTRLEKAECIKMELKEYDKSGRRKPSPIEGSEFFIETDSAILAVSQSSDLPFIKKDEVEITQWGTFVTDKYTYMTKMDGVFAGGDVVRGSDIVITAIADGKNAAKSIDRYLGGKGVLNTGGAIEVPVAQEEKAIVEHERFDLKYLDPENRKNNFSEVALGFHKLNAIAESMRCLRCDRRA
jgi:NADH-quinone oxidoreductase subunit F